MRAVQAGEAVEDRGLRVLADGAKPTWTYSLIWTVRKVAPEQEGGQQADPQRGPVLALRALERPVHRHRRREQDRRVDAGDGDRQVHPLGRPWVVRHDPDEEVGREERSEEHDLGDDEKQHPEQLRLDPRRLVRGRRAVVVVARGRARRRPRRIPSGPRPARGSTTTCSTGFDGGGLDPLDQVRAQPARALALEGRDHDVVDARRTASRSGSP